MKYEAETMGERALLHIKQKYGTQTAAARALGLSLTYINLAIRDKRPVPKKLLDDMGLQRRVIYAPKEPA